jgi:hypothetical protein
MNTYLQAIGWWNLIGSLMMVGFFNQSFGENVLNNWTKIFVTKFSLDYWGKFWLFWAIGLNVFFALLNILSVYWNYIEVKVFIVWFDVTAYLIFIIIGIWGLLQKRCGLGIYIAFLIFSVWIAWGLITLKSSIIS